MAYVRLFGIQIRFHACWSEWCVAEFTGDFIGCIGEFDFGKSKVNIVARDVVI